MSETQALNPQVPQAPEAHQEAPQRQQEAHQGPLSDPRQADNRPQLKHRANEFNGPAAKAAKKAAFLEKLRAEKGVPPAPTAPQAAEQAQPSNETSVVSKSAPQSVTPATETAALFAEFQKQQTAAQQAAQAAAAKEAAAAQRLAAAEAKEAKLRASLENPLDFIAEVGMTADEWTNFLAGGGKLSPEMQKMKQLAAQNAEMQRKFEELQQNLTKEKQNSQLSQRNANIMQIVNELPLLKGVVTPEQIHQQALKMSAAQNHRHVTYKEAAEAFENDLINVWSPRLKDSSVAAKLGISVSKPKSESAAPKQPTTLGKQTAPTSEVSPKHNPRDFKAKKAAFLEMIKRQG